MKTLYTKKGSAVLVDDDVYEWAKKLKLHNGGQGNYAQTNIKGKEHYLHRLIINAQPGQITDHINGNIYDNRRENLRFATASQNIVNRKAHRKDGLKGITENIDKFVASICPRKQFTYLGLYPFAIAAALAYDRAARFLYGEFARPNFNKPISLFKLRDFLLSLADTQIDILWVNKYRREFCFRRFRTHTIREQNIERRTPRNHDIVIFRTADLNCYRTVWINGILAFELNGERYYVTDTATTQKCNNKRLRGRCLSDVQRKFYNADGLPAPARHRSLSVLR